MQSEDKILVRKISPNHSYNARLKKQCKKQSSFCSSLPENTQTARVSAPCVLGSSEVSGLFQFDMEFVNGKTLAEYSSNIKIVEIADFIRVLFKHLYLSTTPDPRAALIFGQKTAQLKSTLALPLLKEPFEILEKYDWKDVCKTPCHGDLTLGNILITSDKRLYLIDFLDSFYNSWMVDVAKLLQDLELGWAFRSSPFDQNRNLRLQVAKEALLEEILCTEAGEKKLETVYHILLLNIIRIYPYAKDDETLRFLNNAVLRLMNILNTKTEVLL